MTKVKNQNIPIEAFIVTEETTDTETITIPVNGVDTEWEYRKVSWFEKNKAVSKATVIMQDENGNPVMGFDVAVYFAEMLQKMLVTAPIPITPLTLKTLKPEIGEVLQNLVPAPMGSGEVVDQAKKD